MNIQFYMPLPPIEFFTWVAVYCHFNLVLLMPLSGFKINFDSNAELFKRCFIGSFIVAPIFLWAVIFKWKESKMHLYQYWIESPDEKHKRRGWF